jgi:predicted transcriptional regulator
MALNYEIKDKKLDKDLPGEKKKIVITETVETTKEISVDELLRKIKEVNEGIERLQGRKQKLVQEVNDLVNQTGIILSAESQEIIV